jgi:hypothetical protein
MVLCTYGILHIDGGIIYGMRVMIKRKVYRVMISSGTDTTTVRGSSGGGGSISVTEKQMEEMMDILQEKQQQQQEKLLGKYQYDIDCGGEDMNTMDIEKYEEWQELLLETQKEQHQFITETFNRFQRKCFLLVECMNSHQYFWIQMIMGGASIEEENTMTVSGKCDLEIGKTYFISHLTPPKRAGVTKPSGLVSFSTTRSTSILPLLQEKSISTAIDQQSSTLPSVLPSTSPLLTYTRSGIESYHYPQPRISFHQLRNLLGSEISFECIVIDISVANEENNMNERNVKENHSSQNDPLSRLLNGAKVRVIAIELQQHFTFDFTYYVTHCQLSSSTHWPKGLSIYSHLKIDFARIVTVDEYSGILFFEQVDHTQIHIGPSQPLSYTSIQSFQTNNSRKSQTGSTTSTSTSNLTARSKRTRTPTKRYEEDFVSPMKYMSSSASKKAKLAASTTTTPIVTSNTTTTATLTSPSEGKISILSPHYYSYRKVCFELLMKEEQQRVIALRKSSLSYISPIIQWIQANNGLSNMLLEIDVGRYILDASCLLGHQSLFRIDCQACTIQVVKQRLKIPKSHILSLKMREIQSGDITLLLMKPEEEAEEFVLIDAVQLCYKEEEENDPINQVIDTANHAAPQQPSPDVNRSNQSHPTDLIVQIIKKKGNEIGNDMEENNVVTWWNSCLLLIVSTCKDIVYS